MPNTAMIASPTNFSTVPPWRSSTPSITSKYRDITRRMDSGSRRSPSSVEPTMSEKRRVTVFRASRPLTPVSAVPQVRQNFARSGFASPHRGQDGMCGVYAWEGLAATSPGRRVLEPICLAYIGATASGLATTGWQMFGHGTENGDLETAFEIGV